MSSDMTSEAHQKFLEEKKRDDDAFKEVLLHDIPYFHKRYAKTKDPQNLEIAKNLGEYLTKLK